MSGKSVWRGISIGFFIGFILWLAWFFWETISMLRAGNLLSANGLNSASFGSLVFISIVFLGGFLIAGAIIGMIVGLISSKRQKS
jgi:hypothetical protein